MDISVTLCGLLLAGSIAGGAVQVAPAARSVPDLQPVAQMLLARDYAQAEEQLRGILPSFPNSAEAHVMLAYALFRENKPAESLKEYTAAAQLRPPSAKDLEWVAQDYVLLDDYTDAAKWMAVSVQMDPANGEAWYSLGRIQYTRNLFQDAEKSFEHALEDDPKSVRAENNLGLTFEALYKMDDAIAAYRNAIAWQQGLAVEDAQPYLNLGIVLLNDNRLEEASTLLRRADAISPNDPKILTQMAKADYAENHLPEAEQELRRALSLTPKDASMHFQLGRVLRKEGKMDEAKVEFASAEKLDGTHSSPDR